MQNKSKQSRNYVRHLIESKPRVWGYSSPEKFEVLRVQNVGFNWFSIRPSFKHANKEEVHRVFMLYYLTVDSSESTFCWRMLFSELQASTLKKHILKSETISEVPLIAGWLENKWKFQQSSERIDFNGTLPRLKYRAFMTDYGLELAFSLLYYLEIGTNHRQKW